MTSEKPEDQTAHMAALEEEVKELRSIMECHGIRVPDEYHEVQPPVGSIRKLVENVARGIVERTVQLEDARAFAENIIDTVREPLLVLDPELRVETANRSFYQDFHVTPEETLGRYLYDLGAGQWNIPELRTLLEDILPSQNPIEGYEVKHDFPSLGERVMRLNARQLQQAARRAPLILVAIEDITEARRSEEESARLRESDREARLSAQEANAAKDQFIALVSHELRNALSPISAAVGLLRHHVPKDGPATRALDIIARNSDIQARLISDLLDYERAARGLIRLELIPVALDTLVQGVVESHRQEAEDAGLSLHVQTAPDVCVEADRDRLQQIVANILTNSIKFTPTGGEVRISVHRQDSKARIVVDDTGIGMDEDTLSHLFQMFRRGERGQRKPGLGVGLALAKSLTELHGGRIWAESEGVGRGSRFTVELPALP